MSIPAGLLEVAHVRGAPGLQFKSSLINVQVGVLKTVTLVTTVASYRARGSTKPRFYYTG